MGNPKYQHVGGIIYEILGFEENQGERLVLYRVSPCQTLGYKAPETWRMSMDYFQGTVTVDGEEVKRFKKIL